MPEIRCLPEPYDRAWHRFFVDGAVVEFKPSVNLMTCLDCGWARCEHTRALRQHFATDPYEDRSHAL